MTETVIHYTPPWSGPKQEEVIAAQAVIDAAREAADEQKRDTLLLCTSQFATGSGCGKMQKVRDTVYIQTHWYVSPHGCTGGDYWNPGEGQYRCNGCGHVNRLYQSPEVEAMKRFFKSVEDRHDDR